MENGNKMIIDNFVLRKIIKRKKIVWERMRITRSVKIHLLVPLQVFIYKFLDLVNKENRHADKARIEFCDESIIPIDPKPLTNVVLTPNQMVDIVVSICEQIRRTDIAATSAWDRFHAARGDVNPGRCELGCYNRAMAKAILADFSSLPDISQF